jgi:hypothetical protein
MGQTAKTFALAALSTTVLTGLSPTEAAVLFDIEGGGPVPTFTYGTAAAANNVINATGVTPTGSTVYDPGSSGGIAGPAWVGSVAGSTAVLSVSGLSGLSGYSINWTYIGSEAANNIVFSIGPNTATATVLSNTVSPFTGDNRNNSCCTWSFSGANPQPVQNLLVTVYSSGGNPVSAPGFTLTDTSTGVHLSNTGAPDSNPIPNGGAANLIFAYLTPHVGLPQGNPPGSVAWDLTTTPTTTVIFGFNDDGSGDDDHDDFMAIASLVVPTTTTPIPGALPLFGSVIAGALGLLGWSRRRQQSTSA